MTIESVKNLLAWQKAFELSKLVYQLTKSFPKEEQYGLTSQVRRAAVSVPSNIAEGYCRNSQGDFVRFLNIAYASLAELETQLLLAKELAFLSDDDYQATVTLSSETGKLINGLIRKYTANGKRQPANTIPEALCN